MYCTEPLLSPFLPQKNKNKIDNVCGKMVVPSTTVDS